jgi:hypothetical protein
MRTRLAWVVAGAIGLCAAAGSARAEETDDRVRRLEEQLRRQTEALERLRVELDAMKRERSAAATDPPVPAAATSAGGSVVVATAPPVPHASPTGPMVPAPSGGACCLPPPPCGPCGSVLVGDSGGFPHGVEWGGYLSLEYVQRSDRNSFIDLHRLILAADAHITRDIEIAMEIEFEHGPHVSDEEEGEIVVEFVDVRWRVADAFVPKAGALLIPFGRYNLYHDDPINDFTLRPFTARFLVPTGFGQPGIGAEGVFGLGGGTTLSYDVALTSGYEDDFTASNGVRGARQAWDGDNNEDKQVWGRVALNVCTPWLDFLEVGASGTWAKYDDEGEDDLLGWGVDVLIQKGPFEVKGEYIAYDYERAGADDVPGAIEGQDGLWLEAAVHFMPGFLSCCRNAFVTDTSHFTLAARYMTMDLDDRVRGAAFNDDLEAWAVGLNYRITERTVLRVDHTWYEPLRGESVREFTASLATYF